jgi:hypothetical protein
LHHRAQIVGRSARSTSRSRWIARLDAVSEPARPFPYYMFADDHQARIHGQVEVTDKPAA